jgi:Lysylphosphatidylglycerol synthase TM region/O-Antigen ligase
VGSARRFVACRTGSKPNPPQIHRWRRKLQHPKPDRIDLAGVPPVPRRRDRQSRLSFSGLLRRSVVPVIGIAAAIFVLVHFDLRQVFHTASLVSLQALSAASAAIAAGLVISCLRYRWALAALGLRVPMKAAFQANLIGIVGGLLFFQMLGQTLARTLVLARQGIGGAAVLLANVYERVTAVLSLAVLALFGLIYLYRGVTIDIVGAAGLIKLAGVFALTSLVVVSTAARRIARLFVMNVARLPALGGISKVGLCSIGMHLTTLAAYVGLGHAFAPTVNIIDLAAASLVVMFAASLPISFAGWGVREVSAVYAYGTIGISADQALATSILVGALSLAALAVITAATYFGHLLPNVPEKSIERTDERITRRSAELTRGFSVLIPLIAALLVFFQVYVPTEGGKINLNLADPVAVGGAIVFLSLYATRPDRRQMWKIDHFETMLIVASGTMLVGFLIGWARFGVTDWALYNRLIGWFVLLSYVATGALIVGATRTMGLTVFLRVILIAGLTVASADLVLLFMAVLGLPVSAFLPQGPITGISGMSQNANAFALQLSVILAIACALESRGKLSVSGADAKPFILVLTILLLAIIFAKSRTGYITVAATLCGVTWLRWVRWQSVVIAGLAALVVAVLPLGLRSAGELVWSALHLSSMQISPEQLPNILMPTPKSWDVSSDAERWFTIKRGLELWFEHPIFGAGLGAFVHAVEAENGVFLVIHGSAIWLLAEFGVVGLTIFATGFVLLLWSAWRGAEHGAAVARVLLLVLLSFALFQTIHDAFYQRIFWLILGATIFRGGLVRSKTAVRV